MKTPVCSLNRNWKLAPLLALLALMPLLGQAHILHGEARSFVSGLNHPWHGLDHVLAMVAVGLWAAQLGGRSLWLVPASFVVLMGVGGTLGTVGLSVPMVELGILLSVLTLGLLIAASVRLPAAAGMALVGLFAIFHGHAHGTEIPDAASGLAYGLGFALATAALHGCGMGLGLVAQRKLAAPMVRYAGAAIVLAGLGLCLG